MVNCYSGNLSRHNKCLWGGGGREREKKKLMKLLREKLMKLLTLLDSLLDYQVTSVAIMLTPATEKKSFNMELGKRKSSKGKGIQDLLLIFE